MRSLPRNVPEPRTDRYATHLMHDAPHLRVVAFHLLQGQSVPPHRSHASVLVQVVEGSGLFRGEDGEVLLGAGQGAVYDPGELHSMEAAGGELRFLAILAPGPAAETGGG